MGKGFGNMGGMGNMAGLMKQAQKLQKEMAKSQEELQAMTFQGSSTNDYVQAKVTGERKLVALEIDEKVIDPEDSELLADLVMMAVNDALAKVEKESETKMGSYAKGMPGFGF